MAVLLNIWLSLLAGIFAPLGAVCVLPLYPGFLAYLSSQFSGKEDKKSIIMFGVITVVGVITSMFLFGLIFVFLLQESLTNAIAVISPIAFGILALVSLLMIFNVNIGALFPKFNAPIKKNPFISSFIFGFFFGAIVLPCNPASLIVLFALTTSVTDAVANLFNFVFFGFGMALPLLIFAVISAQYSKQVIGWLSKNQRGINLIAGLIMLGISLYYLFFVFKVI